MTVAGALFGATVDPVKYQGDLENTISLGTAAAYKARDLFRESEPYYKQYDENGTLIIYPTYHFLRELRRQLSGEATDTGAFSPAEITFYKEFIEYQEGVSKTGTLLLALETLDNWLVDEIQENIHPELDRDYTSDHKWSKRETRDEDMTWL